MLQDDGTIEPFIWFKTEKEAKEKAKKWKKNFPEDSKDLHIGKILL